MCDCMDVKNRTLVGRCPVVLVGWVYGVMVVTVGRRVMKVCVMIVQRQSVDRKSVLLPGSVAMRGSSRHRAETREGQRNAD